jgi:hypothetical protein
MSEERIVTSAIENMSVAQVRKALSQMRKDWSSHSSIQPFYPSTVLVDDMSVSCFAFKFVMGHHSKRHTK